MPLNSFQTSGNSPGAQRLAWPARCRVDRSGFAAFGSAIARGLASPDSSSSPKLTSICDRAKNKRVIAHCGEALLTLAERHGRRTVAD